MTLRAGLRWIIGAVLVLVFAARYFPALLVFPYHAQAGALEVWSETPIDQARLDAVVADSTRLLAASPLYRAPERRKVFLTQHSWRWTWLTLNQRGAFAISPPLTGSIIVNSSSISGNVVGNGRAIGGLRSLSGIIAHETCHEMERRHFGLTSDWLKPVWLREGYCDYVAQESSLSEADYTQLVASHADHPALPYYIGRKRVAAELTANGGNVDALFAAY